MVIRQHAHIFSAKKHTKAKAVIGYLFLALLIMIAFAVTAQAFELA